MYTTKFPIALRMGSYSYIIYYILYIPCYIVHIIYPILYITYCILYFRYYTVYILCIINLTYYVITEILLGRIPERLPERTLERLPGRLPERLSERLPKMLPERPCESQFCAPRRGTRVPKGRNIYLYIYIYIIHQRCQNTFENLENRKSQTSSFFSYIYVYFFIMLAWQWVIEGWVDMGGVGWVGA